MKYIGYYQIGKERCNVAMEVRTDLGVGTDHTQTTTTLGDLS